MSLILEVGKYYKTRNGKKAYVAGISPFSSVDDACRVVGFIEDDCDCTSWSVEGAFYPDELSEADLVEEWMESFTLDVWATVPKRGAPCWLDINFYSCEEQAAQRAAASRRVVRLQIREVD